MKLVRNWKAIALHAHSMWAFYLSLVALVMPDVLFLILERDPVSPRVWWLVAFALIVYGIWGRLKDQGLDR